MKFYGSAILVAAVLVLATHKAHAGMDIVLPSLARTATQTSADFVKTTERAVDFVLVVTAVPGVQTLTLTIQGKDAAGNYYPLVATTASAATGTFRAVAGLGVAIVANVATGTPLPDVYRVVVTHSGAGSFTYSLARNTAQ
jgi:hypothetical protein